MFDFYIQELLICLNLSGDIITTFCASVCEHVCVRVRVCVQAVLL